MHRLHQTLHRFLPYIATISVAFLFMVMYSPDDSVMHSDRMMSLAVSVFLLSVGMFLLIRLGLPMVRGGEAYQSVIPGILESRVPAFLARLLGAFYIFLGGLAVLVSIVLFIVCFL